jgi:hypothetical protein
MPYIYCETCGAGHYNNVLSCPACGARVRATRVRGLAVTRRTRRRPRPLLENVEDEVREALYGWHSGCVERRGEEPA